VEYKKKIEEFFDRKAEARIKTADSIPEKDILKIKRLNHHANF